MSEIPAGGLFNINFQSDVDAYRLRENFERQRVAHNDTERKMLALATPPAGTEVTLARDYADSLTSRLVNATKGVKNMVLSGLLVTEQSTPDMTVKVSAGDAIIDGVYCRKGLGRGWVRSGAVISITEPTHGFTAGQSIHIEASSDTGALPLGTYTISSVGTNLITFVGVDTGATSGTCDFGRNVGPVVAAGASAMRNDVVCLNADNTFSIVTGTEHGGGTWEIPAIASNQRPLAILKILAATTSLNDGTEIKHNCQTQGCIVTKADAVEAWYFSIQDAVDTIGANGTEIVVYPGNYYEEVDLAGFSNFSLIFKKGATIYRPSSTGRCIVADNSGGCFSIKIGGDVTLNDNSMAGSVELVYLHDISILDISGLSLGENASSSATYKEVLIDSCNYVTLGVTYAVSEFEIGFTSCTYVKKNYASIGAETVLRDGASTQNEIFDALAPYIPRVNETTLIRAYHSPASGSAGIYTIALRYSSTVIHLLGCKQDCTTGAITGGETKVITDADSSSTPIYLVVVRS